METEDYIFVSVPDETEIDVSYLKELIRKTNYINNKPIQVKVGVGVLASREARMFLKRIKKHNLEVDLTLTTDSLPSKLQIEFIRRNIMKEIRVKFLKPNAINN